MSLTNLSDFSQFHIWIDLVGVTGGGEFVARLLVCIIGNK